MNISHRVQLLILKELLFNPKAHFAQLNKTGLTNDHFTFHLNHLIENGIIQKEGGYYKLTPIGLEIAGRLDVKTMKLIKQPKVGVSLCVTRDDEKEILIGRRLRDPNKGLCGFYAEKVRFGESLLDAAERCLLNETGLKAQFVYAGELHIIRKVKGVIVVDVLFTCFKTKKLSGKLKEKTKESENFWVLYQDAYNLPNSFQDLKIGLDLYKKQSIFFKELFFNS